MHLTLALETSCDETSAAVIADGRVILSNIISTQVPLHQKYGGVVPEIASRKHIETVLPVIKEALAQAGVSLADIDVIGVTYGPGLVGALLVGVAAAKALAYGLDKPLVGVNHLEGHIFANFLAHTKLEPPFAALVVSGGHTSLIHVRSYSELILLGQTRDDAAGEAFDKTAKLLGLPYPGGPVLAELAAQGRPDRFKLPRPMLNSGDFDFSFSGLKTAVLTAVRSHLASQEATELDAQTRADVARAFQDAIVEVLVKKAMRAVKASGLGQLVVAGGVGANRELRRQLDAKATKARIEVFYPELEFCTDNGAMIALAGALRLKSGAEAKTAGAFAVRPRWPLDLNR